MTAREWMLRLVPRCRSGSILRLLPGIFFPQPITDGLDQSAEGAGNQYRNEMADYSDDHFRPPEPFCGDIGFHSIIFGYDRHETFGKNKATNPHGTLVRKRHRRCSIIPDFLSRSEPVPFSYPLNIQKFFRIVKGADQNFRLEPH
ncbi:hypothetical protein SDC9_70792 [bioreactor metagenome]|uniref:Uncharacterized protein n=1 Tax=bioreactor metagenome TaxID=1076179 RepID=A0A644Y8R4_9ZZZZ